jgi:hypothetical protein
MPGLPDFNFDLISFALGFFAATVIWWLVNRARSVSSKLETPVKERMETIRQGNMVGINRYLRQEMIHLAQRMHFARELFALDNILITPRFLAPLPTLDPEKPLLIDTIANQVIPYMPEWPEFSAQYSVPLLSLPQILQGGGHIVLVGQPGSGRTFALAHLTIQIANRDPRYRSFVENVPFYIHIMDVDLTPTKTMDPLDNIIAVIHAQVAVVFQSRLPRFMRTAAKKNRFMLMLDGLDELPPDMLTKVAEYLRSLLERYPHIRVVATGAPEYVNGLMDLGFTPFALAAWDTKRVSRFLNRWASAWSKEIAPLSGKSIQQGDLDPRIMTNWLNHEQKHLTPLEWTLKAWAAYSGDALGPTPIHALEAYLQRVTQSKVPHEAMETAAFEMVRLNLPVMPTNQIEKLLSGRKPDTDSSLPLDETLDNEESETQEQSRRKKARKKRTISSRSRILSMLVDSGVLIENLDGNLKFFNPVVCGYLSSFQASKEDTPGFELSEAHLWQARSSTLRFLAAQSKKALWIEEFAASDTSPIYPNTMMVGRWLRDAHVKSEWRPIILRRIASLLQDEMLPFAIRIRFMAIFVVSGDTSLQALFKQLMDARSPAIRELAALGSGAMQNDQLLDELLNLFNDEDSDVRLAAGMAVAALDTNQSNKILLEILKEGEENLRLVVAETLASQPPEGHKILRGAATDTDLLTRRAAIFGLSQIREKWVIDILEKAAIEDGQWVVRNAASQALENFQGVSPFVPTKLPPPHEAPWLIAFAGQNGMGITPHQPVTDILLMALESDLLEHRIAALSYLCDVPSEGVIKSIYEVIYHEHEPQLIEAALYTLWLIALRGTVLPSPVKFGL